MSIEEQRDNYNYSNSYSVALNITSISVYCKKEDQKF